MIPYNGGNEDETFVLLCVLLLVSVVTASAITTSEKETIYNAAINQLETYLEDQQEDYGQLADIYNSFKNLKGYEKSSGFASYCLILMLVAEDEIDEGELDYQLSKLKKNTVFVEYLTNNYKDSAIGVFDDLENYVRGRVAEVNETGEADAYYEACLYYFDAEARYDNLHDSATAEHYENAMQLFRQKQYEEAYKEFVLAGNYEDSTDRMVYIIEILGYTPVLEHEHEWVSATCLAPKTCSICQATEGEPLGHNMDEGRVTKQASCNENGEMVYTCKDCGTTDVKVIRATGNHMWGEGVVTSVQTCTASGKTTYTCLVCGEQKVEEVAKVGEHSWDGGKVTKEASCTENGTKTYTCTRCGDTRKETINAYGSHDWDGGTVTKEATCTENGTKTFRCRRCGEKKTETITASGNHNWDGGSITKEATCTENGTKTYTCRRCGQTRKETINATGEHNWDGGSVTKEATCTENGTKTYTCRRCGQTRRETISATGNHNWDRGTVTKEATCGSSGTLTIRCRNCGASYTENIPATGDHRWQEATTSAPKTCRVCGKTEGNKLTTYYRYRDTRTVYSDWSWGDWSTSQKSISDSNLMKEETRTVQMCEWWCAKCKNCGMHNPYQGSSTKCHGCGTTMESGKWSTARHYTEDWNYSLSTYNGRSGAHQFSDGWFWKTGDKMSVTQYRYATRSTSQVTDSWSSWSTTQPASQSGREIETKTE